MPRSELGELLVGGAEPQRGAQIVAFQREEAGVEAALGREAGARAAAAERLRDRGDDADLAGAVAVAEAAGGLVGAGRLERLERPDGVDRARRSRRPETTSSRRQPFVWPTSMYSMKRSVCGVPRKCSASATMPSSFAPRLTTAFTLTRRPAAAAASIPSSTCCDGEVDVVQRAEGGVVDRVEADGDAVEAGARERLGLLRQQRAVRRERELEAGNRVQQLDEVLDVAAHERLAAGDPHDAHAELGEDARRRARSPRSSAAPCARGRRGRGRRPPSACSRRSGSCSGR